MKRLLSLLLCALLLMLSSAVADVSQELAASGFIGEWIETEGYGTLTLRMDGTASMVYYEGTVSDFHWELTDAGAVCIDGMWYNSAMELLDENTLSVADGWMIFAREGFMPTTDPALLLHAEPVGEEGEPFLGEWTLTSLVVEGETLDPSFFSMNLTFNADGTLLSDDGIEPYTTTWFVSYGNAVVEGDILVLDENDQLHYTASDGEMIFTRILPEAPIEEPAEPSITPEAAPTPVGEAGEPFLGTWTLSVIEAEGMSMDPALLGMTMTLTLTEDGLISVCDDLDTQITTWYVENGAAMVEGSALTLNPSGQLTMADEDGTVMIFVQGETTSGAELSEDEQLLALLAMLASLEEDDLSDLPEELRGFVGDWYLCYCATGGLTGDLRPFGVTGMLSLQADGTGVLSGLADETGEWYDDEGIVRFGESGMPLFLHGAPDEPDGFFLQYGSDMGGYLIFHQDENAVWDPAIHTPLPAAEPTAIPSAQPALSAISAPPASHVNTRFVCTSYTAAGYTADASILGAEYALLFRENGTADFTMAGFTMENLPYTVTDDGVYAINYYGAMFNCIPTDTGFDMDYYGTMLMHFVPAE